MIKYPIFSPLRLSKYILYSIADCFCAITFKSWTSLCWSKLTPGKVLMLCNAFWASRAAFRVKNVTKQQPKERKKELFVLYTSPFFNIFYLNKEKIIIQPFLSICDFYFGELSVNMNWNSTSPNRTFFQILKSNFIWTKLQKSQVYLL